MEREKELAPVRIALLIDGENVGAKHFPAIAKKVGKLGHPVVRRLFGMSKDWEAVAREKALKVEWQASGGKGKNTVDIAMAVHAMDIVHRGLADAICLVSSDCDFQPLAIHLREAGTTVYGMGEEKTDRSLREAYKEFHVLAQSAAEAVNTKPTPTPAPEKPSATSVPQQPKASKPLLAANAADVIMKLMPAPSGWIGLQQLGTKLRGADAKLSETLKNGRLYKLLDASPLFELRGSGTDIQVSLKAGAKAAQSTAP